MVCLFVGVVFRECCSCWCVGVLCVVDCVMLYGLCSVCVFLCVLASVIMCLCVVCELLNDVL